MTVKELIKKLEVIEDKEAEVNAGTGSSDWGTVCIGEVTAIYDSSETTKEVIIWHD